MYCLLYDPATDGYWEFKNPQRIIQTSDSREVTTCLSAVERESKRNRTVVGFVTYEASPAFDDAFETHKPGPLPLLLFGVFNTVDRLNPETISRKEMFAGWHPTVQKETYTARIQAIKNHIAEGDTYQVNYTFKLSSRFSGDPRQAFLAIQEELKAGYAAYIELEHQVLCCFSPELFFTWQGDRLLSKPMKGTAPRGMTLAEDREQMRCLSRSEKNRAENIMIVDMIRNDMGRIAEPGSVEVCNRFAVEKHPYVLQMTSTVASRVNTTLSDIFKALFPCGSITGAPKVRTMEIIKTLESEARGIYTGTIGCVYPDGSARFNVAIRTLVLDQKTGFAEYGVGSGIVWDSETGSEYEECLLKAEFLSRPQPRFKLLESLLWENDKGYFLLEEHLERLADSAAYFGFRYDRNKALTHLERLSLSHRGTGAKVRLLLDKQGKIVLESGLLDGVKSSDLVVGLAKTAIHSRNRFLYHKTTHRQPYENARAERLDCDDVILWNEKGEITESCRSNVVVKIDGQWVTPPVHCGLLAGTYRRYLLQSGAIRERIVTINELQTAEEICTINSVRGWMTATLG